MVYEVYKRISMGRDPETQEESYLATGTLVETGSWRNEKTLIDLGYLGPPRKSQTEINKFLAKNSGKEVAKNTKVVGVKRPAIEPKLKGVPTTV